MTAFVDMGDQAEDARIEIIGEAAMKGAKVAFITDDDDKAERYVRKLLAKFPELEIVRVRFAGRYDDRNTPAIHGTGGGTET